MSDEIPQKQGKVGYKNPPEETRFKPGQSGNPGGNYKRTPKISNAYDRLLAMTPAEFATYEAKNVAEEIALMQVRAAMRSGSALASVKEITDRTEGKAKQSIVVEESNNDDAAFQMFWELIRSQGLNLDEEVARQQFNALREAEQQRLM